MDKRLFPIVIVVCLLAFPFAAHAEQTLFGVKMGMTAEEVGKVWKPMEEGKYYIKDSILFNVATAFDHRGSLYVIKFTVPVAGDHPKGLTNKAAMKVINNFFKEWKEVSVNLKSGRGEISVTLTDKALLKGYEEAIALELRNLLRP